MDEGHHRSDSRAVQIKFRLSTDRRNQLRKLAREAGVSEQTFIEARVLGIPFDQATAPGRTKGLRNEGQLRMIG